MYYYKNVYKIIYNIKYNIIIYIVNIFFQQKLLLVRNL